MAILASFQAAHENAVLATILRRATLPTGERPRRAVELAELAKMDTRRWAQ